MRGCLLFFGIAVIVAGAVAGWWWGSLGVLSKDYHYFFLGVFFASVGCALGFLLFGVRDILARQQPDLTQAEVAIARDESGLRKLVELHEIGDRNGVIIRLAHFDVLLADLAERIERHGAFSRRIDGLNELLASARHVRADYPPPLFTGDTGKGRPPLA